MGILNITPDSFSDGGLYNSPERAAIHAKKLMEEGAHILDIGGESTRPGSKPITAAEELRRVIPVIERIRRFSDIPLSVDTQKAKVAGAALDAGADMINDVSAGRHDPELFSVVAKADAPLIIMHMKGIPETMQLDPRYEGNVMLEIHDFLAERIAQAERAGVSPSNLLIDPGIGFGKSAEDNIAILRNIDCLSDLYKPILIGTSRKSFIGKLLGYNLHQRLEPTLATLAKSFEKGARIFRVHEVGPAARYFSMMMLLSQT
jgi:dihydropteroate synthase